MATSVISNKGREVVWKKKTVKVFKDGQLVAEYRLMNEKQAERFFIATAEVKL